MMRKLREVLDREDTVLFVGAGLSMWSKLPSWRQLISQLAAYVEEQGYSAELIAREYENNDLLQAASYGADLLTPTQFANFIWSVCHSGRAEPHDIHKLLVTNGASATN